MPSRRVSLFFGMPALCAVVLPVLKAQSVITNISPGSNLLAPGSSTVALSFNTPTAALCRYSVGASQAFGSMQAFDTGAPATAHQGTVQGLSSNPGVVNNVYLACDSAPNSVTSLQYRSAASPTGPFPRIGSIWWGSYIANTQPSLDSKIQMFLCPAFNPGQALAVRAANPNVLMLTNVNAMEATSYTSPPNVPEAYYLHDTTGKRIPNWPTPGDYILNMTNPAVADFLANYAYQVLLQSGLVYDGIFFDNFNTSISWLKTDYAGDPVQIDADGDGKPDNPATDDAEWSTGVYRLIASFRKLAPYALATGHLGQRPPQSPSLAVFNGESMNGDPPQVREGVRPFSSMWQTLGDWSSQGQQPGITLLQSSPPLQVAYGYGFMANKVALPSTQAFAQTFYPNMRFGLGTALMMDGFSTYDYGDTSSSVNWWYDEYDFYLGYPLGPATRIVPNAPATPSNLLVNGAFESTGIGPWIITSGSGGKASAALDNTVAAEGNSSARIAVTATSANPWQVTFEQDNISITKGVTYQVQFWARSDTPRTMSIICQGGAPNFTNYGLYGSFALGRGWNLFTTSFTAAATATDGRLEFWLGDQTGNVWIDGAQFFAPNAPDVYRRDFTSGVVLLNATAGPQTIPLEAGLKRFSGTQAPRFQYIVDDSDSSFATSGSWSAATMDSGFSRGTVGPGSQLANGPYYHAWQTGVHQSSDVSGSATWNLHIPEDGSYTLQVWLPAAPGSGSWTTNAVYDVIVGGQTIASVTLDQSSARQGDTWHMLGTWQLTASGATSLRVHNGGGGPLIADAVYLTSAALYNDGSSASQVTLAPFDALLLQRQQPVAVPASRVNAVVGSADGGSNIASGAFVTLVGTGFTNVTRSWGVSDFQGNQLPQSLNGVSVSINGLPAAVEYISPTQINVIAPDDTTLGTVNAQVNTPQGKSYPGTASKFNASPAFFRFPDGGTSYVVAQHLGGTLVAKTPALGQPASPGETIILYATGFGATNPLTPWGTVAPQPNPIAKPVTVTIGGVDAVVSYAGVIQTGLVQINVRVPPGLQPGDQTVTANVAGFQTASSALIPVGN
jgi:uncharacterized protein (TIGR03437 family)